MKFDSMRAWNEGLALIRANREVLIALAGVFLMLPTLAILLFAPPPEVTGKQGFEALVTIMRDYYNQNWMVILPLALVTIIGTLAILALFSERGRPTVAEAMKQGTTALLPLILAQLLLGLLLALGGGLLMLLSAFTGLKTVIAVVLMMVVLLAIYAGLRMILISPVVVIERIFNPVSALRRAWGLTRGTFWQLLLFFVLLFLATGLVTGIATSLIELLFTAITGSDGGKIAGDVASSAFGAITNTLYIALLAATHRQLTSQTPSGVAKAFD